MGDPHIDPAIIADGYRQFIGGEVDSWHYAMMNDAVRNSAYESALGAVLKKGGTVLDIGTGSGLLAMMAIRQGASHVITCEGVPMIARKAKEIIKHNGFEGRIEVINKRSLDLVAGVDFATRADVLVTEIFDDGLLGEYAFAAIQHARDHLLKPGAHVIPAGAKVWAMAIESREIFENHRVEQAAGFDVSAFNEFSPDIYVGYHLDKMKYRALSAPKASYDFDFLNIPGNEKMPFDLDVIADGTCHAIAYWYQLKLDASTVLSTGPGLSRLSSWKQAVQILEEPRELGRGDCLKLFARHDSEALWFSSH